MPVRAFLFDFDGLIIDTETASRAGWAWLYRQHGFELSLDDCVTSWSRAQYQFASKSQVYLRNGRFDRAASSSGLTYISRSN